MISFNLERQCNLPLITDLNAYHTDNRFHLEILCKFSRDFTDFHSNPKIPSLNLAVTQTLCSSQISFLFLFSLKTKNRWIQKTLDLVQSAHTQTRMLQTGQR